MSFAVSVNQMTKRYGSFKAVDNISFQVNQGEIFGLLGPNGAGKTTALECIEGVKSFDNGTIKLFGEKAGSQAIHKLIGVQLQSSSLPAYITALEAMTLFCKWQQVPVRRDLLETFGFKEPYKQQYNTLSTGQKRRLHLALALAHNPQLLILDEPTAGLDVEGRASLHNELRRLKSEGVTMMIASHDMAEVEALCDNIAILINGQISIIGTPMEITAAGDTHSKIIVKTSKDSLLNDLQLKHNRLVDISGQYAILLATDIMLALTEIMDKLKQANDSITDLRVERPSLEERFLQLVDKKGETK